MRRKAVKQLPYTEVQKLKLDLDASNRLLMRDPNMVMAVVQKFMPYNPMALFGIALTGQENGLDDVSIGRRDWPESILKWRITDNRRPPIEILDNSSVPNVIKGGMVFPIGVDAGYIDANAVLDTEDPDFQLFVQSRLATAGKKTMLMVQAVNSDTTTTLTKLPSLLQYGRKLSFSGDNGVGERSAKGQLAIVRQYGYEEMYNIMQTLRTDYEASGHFLSTKMWTVLAETFMEGGAEKVKMLGALPFSDEAMTQHLMAISHRLYNGRGNLDIDKKQIINQSPDGPYSERPLASGLREFYHQTENQFDYNPYQPDKLIGLMNHAADIARDRMREVAPDQQMDFKIIVRKGGRRAVLKAWENIFVKGAQHLQVTANSQNKVMVGFGYEGFQTLEGDTFRMANIDPALPRDAYREQATVDGVTADKDSWEIAIIPIYKIKETLGRNNINVVTKKHTLGDGTVINRGLVVGRQAGMTGLTNSTGMDMGNVQTAAINSAYKEGFRVDSMVDKESLAMLSEFSMAVYNPDDIILLKPQFPASVY